MVKGKNDKEKFRPRSREYNMCFRQKTGLLRPLAFLSPPFLIPLVLRAELSDKKANWESRRPRMSRKRRRRDIYEAWEIQQRPWRYLYPIDRVWENVYCIVFGKTYFFPSQRAIFLSTCAKSRPAFFVISGSGWAKWIARTSCGPAGLLKWMNLSDGFMWSFETRCPLKICVAAQ